MEPKFCVCGNHELNFANDYKAVLIDKWYHGQYRCYAAYGPGSEESKARPLKDNEVLIPERVLDPKYDKIPEGHPEFEGGGVREAQGDRPRFELLVPNDVPFEDQILTRFAVHMAKGAEKYAARNWEKFSDAEAFERAKSSAFRHLIQWMTGVEDGEDHAAAVMFNVMCGEHILRKADRAVSERQPW